MVPRERGQLPMPPMSQPPDDTVRRASAADAAEVGRLLHDFNTEFSEPTPGPAALKQRVGELLAGDEATILLAGERPDGVAVIRFRRAIFTEGLDAYLEELYVRPDLRGQGLGRALLAAAMETARRQGATRMDLGTEETDTAAIALYKSAGFSNQGGKDGGPLSYFYERDL
jgi:ribosomal protein S18 acetylase RimI-like enzyme